MRVGFDHRDQDYAAQTVCSDGRRSTAALGIAERSVRRDWQKARVLLHEELKP